MNNYTPPPDFVCTESVDTERPSVEPVGAPRDGEFVAATSPSHESALDHTRQAFADAQARLRAAHRVVAENIDQRFARRFAAQVDAVAIADTERAAGVAQNLRDDFAARQHQLSNRLAERMQSIASADVDAAADIGALAGEAAAQPVRNPPRDRTTLDQ